LKLYGGKYTILLETLTDNYNDYIENVINSLEDNDLFILQSDIGYFNNTEYPFLYGFSKGEFQNLANSTTFSSRFFLNLTFIISPLIC